MTWMDVVGGEPPPSFPAGQGYSAYYSLAPADPPAAPSALSATAVSSSAIDLTWTDNSNDETTFNIERSLDGAVFIDLASVAADVTSYADTGLSPETTYWYRVNAENTGGTSAWSNTASAATLADTGPTSVTVGSVTVITVGAAKGLKRGQATVVVVDDLGGPVAGATVTGDFTGTFNEAGVSGPLTDATGTTLIETNGTAKKPSVTFCVTSIGHPTLNDWEGAVCDSS